MQEPGQAEKKEWTVDGLETAIRNALARSDRSDPAARARIYDSARAAVEKSLQNQPGAPDAAAVQRRRVEEVIAAIEAGDPVPLATQGDVMSDSAAGPAALSVAAGPDDSDAPSVELPPDTPEASAIGGLQARPEDRLGRAPTAERPAARPAGKRARNAGKRGLFFRGSEKPTRPERRRRGGIGSLLTQLLFLFVVIGIVLWWISSNGGIEQIGRQIADSGVGMLSEPEDNAGLIEPAQRVGAGQFAGNWITVFAASSAETVDAGGAATVEMVDEGEEPALRIVSVSGGDAGEVRIPLDAEALAAASGEPVLFALTMRAAGDEPTQIYLRCDFAGPDDCNRRRFEVNYEVTDIVFEADLSPARGSDAALILNSDLAGEGKSVDLFSIRIQPAE